MSTSPPALARGREAYERREWRTTWACLTEADRASPLDPDDLSLLATAAYLIGREDDFLAALERAHRARRDEGDAPAAAACAFWLGLHLANRGEVAAASGWFGRATRLLDSAGGEHVERGHLLLPGALRCLAAGDHGAAYEHATKAAAIAQRFGDRELLALAVNLQGQALLRQARVPEGLALLDEAMLAVAGGELSPVVTGLIYCSVLSACRNVYALGRAREWTAALSDWCERQPDMVAYRGECQIYRAELMQLRGAWEESIEETRRACQVLPGASLATGLALYQEGEVRRLLGEFAAAEEAYRAASLAGREPQPGLALLRLAQGELDAAVAATRRALGETTDALRRARLLPAHIEILLARGEHRDAAAACAELERIAADHGSGVLGTIAAHARGAVELESGSPEAALPHLRRAASEWRALEAPYETARARMLLARVCQALGDADSAGLELDAARAVFQQLGATPDLARLEGVREQDRHHGLTPREVEVLRQVATGRTNREIATELFISEKTVARHLSNIFRKLGLGSRAAATAYAYEHDLLGPEGPPA